MIDELVKSSPRWDAIVRYIICCYYLFWIFNSYSLWGRGRTVTNSRREVVDTPSILKLAKWNSVRRYNKKRANGQSFARRPRRRCFFYLFSNSGKGLMFWWHRTRELENDWHAKGLSVNRWAEPTIIGNIYGLLWVFRKFFFQLLLHSVTNSNSASNSFQLIRQSHPIFFSFNISSWYSIG